MYGGSWMGMRWGRWSGELLRRDRWRAVESPHWGVSLAFFVNWLGGSYRWIFYRFRLLCER